MRPTKHLLVYRLVWHLESMRGAIVASAVLVAITVPITVSGFCPRKKRAATSLECVLLESVEREAIPKRHSAGRASPGCRENCGEHRCFGKPPWRSHGSRSSPTSPGPSTVSQFDNLLLHTVDTTGNSAIRRPTLELDSAGPDLDLNPTLRSDSLRHAASTCSTHSRKNR